MIRIVTDSTCDLPAELVERYGIRVVPMSINFGDDSYSDGETIGVDEFYTRLQSGDFPKTSYPPLGRFVQVLDAEMAAGNEVLIITLAKALSGCYDSVSMLLEEYPADRVAVFDSKAATLAQGAVVLAAARMVEAGASYQQVKEAMPGIIARKAGYGAINNLTYLARGGRIGGATAALATALNIKPIINICDDGSLEAGQKVRGMAKAINWVVERLKQEGTDFSSTTIFIGYILQQDAAGQMAERMRAELTLGEVMICPIGPTVGTHLGPGAVGVFYLKPEN